MLRVDIPYDNDATRDGAATMSAAVTHGADSCRAIPFVY